MEFLGMDLDIFFKVLMLNIVLSGDNAILIALATRNLKPELKNKAMFWGIVGAVVLRLIFTIVVSSLMKIPLLSAIAGLLLINVAYKLLAGGDDHGDVIASSSLGAAIRTIIIADALMSLDNVLAIAGVAENFKQIIIGIAISVPIIVFASQLIMVLMTKYPLIVFAGAGILAWASGEMIVRDSLLTIYLDDPNFQYGIPAAITTLTLLAGSIKKKKIADEHKHIA